jgi:CheY-like chemotaxis protein
MNANDIPLKILVCDPDHSSAEVLRASLTQQTGLTSTVVTAKIPDAQAKLRGGDINTIFIDVIGLGIDTGADFVFSVRKALPEIVFVLYIDRSVAESARGKFYEGERGRLLHYYTLDKRTPAAAFTDELRALLATCRTDLSWRLSETSLERLRQEAAALGAGQHPQDGIALATHVEEIVTRVLAQKSPNIAKRSVFLSHRFAEKEYVEGLTRLLENEGFSVITGRSANTYISQAILQRVKEAEFFLCLMTRDKSKADGTYTTSSWLLEEKGAALAFGKRIVLMVEEGVEDVGGLQGDWQRIHFGPKGFLTAALEAVAQLKSYSGG